MTKYSLLITAARELDHIEGLDAAHIQSAQICPCSISRSYATADTQTVIVFPRGQAVPENSIKQGANSIQELFISSNVRGALISALFGLEYLDLERPLVISSGNSLVTKDFRFCFDSFISGGADAGIIAFQSNKPFWSYAEVDLCGKAAEIHEKKVVGNLASTGVIIFKTGNLFLESAKWALLNNAKLNNNFYVSTALNYLITQGKTIAILEISPSNYTHQIYGGGSS